MTKSYNWKKGINTNELDEVIDIINSNGIIIFPTETVYGIGGNALSENVIKHIYEVKNRPSQKPLSILLKSKKEIEKYAEITSDIERKIIEKFMPGPITLIMKKKENVLSDLVTAGNSTIGIRIPNEKIIKQILERLNFPIVAPSANISGEPSVTKAEDISKEFDGKIDAIIDGGICKEKISSTIIQIIDNKPVILREGSIRLEDIMKKI